MTKLERIEYELEEIMEHADYEDFLEEAADLISSSIGCYCYPSNLRDDVREGSEVKDTLNYIEENWDI